MLGWKRHSPFDAILVAAAPVRSRRILNQLSGGRLIIPIGISEDQKLMLYIKTKKRNNSEGDSNRKICSFAPRDRLNANSFTLYHLVYVCFSLRLVFNQLLLENFGTT